MCFDMSNVKLSHLQFAASTFTGIAGYTKDKQAQDIAAANANQVRDIGLINELMFRDQARRDIAEQTARLANSGVDISSGTPLLLIAESAKNRELDALAIRRNARSREDAYRMQADAFGQSAPMSLAGGFLDAYARSTYSPLSSLASVGSGSNG